MLAMLSWLSFFYVFIGCLMPYCSVILEPPILTWVYATSCTPLSMILLRKVEQFTSLVGCFLTFLTHIVILLKLFDKVMLAKKIMILLVNNLLISNAKNFQKKNFNYTIIKKILIICF